MTPRSYFWQRTLFLQNCIRNWWTARLSALTCPLRMRHFSFPHPIVRFITQHPKVCPFRRSLTKLRHLDRHHTCSPPPLQNNNIHETTGSTPTLVLRLIPLFCICSEPGQFNFDTCLTVQQRHGGMARRSNERKESCYFGPFWKLVAGSGFLTAFSRVETARLDFFYWRNFAGGCDGYELSLERCFALSFFVSSQHAPCNARYSSYL